MTAAVPQTLPLNAALEQAVAHHQAGRLQQAEQLYHAILQAQIDHPDANHNLGVLAVQVKQPVAGLPHFKAALGANPNQRQYWLSYIDALIQAGQSDTARQVLEQGRQRGLQGGTVEELARRLEGCAQIAAQSKEKTPSPQEMNMLVKLFTDEQYAEASSLAQTMTVRFPLYGFSWKVLGASYNQMGRSADALAPMQKAVVLSPGDAAAHYNLGIILSSLRRLDEAEGSYRRALEIKPDYAEAHSNLGLLLKSMGRAGEAEASYRQALQIRPDLAETHSNLGNILHDLGRLGEAEASLRRALEIKPDFAEAYYNLGNILKELGQLNGAIASYRRALEIKPDFAEAHFNLGNALYDLSLLDEAEARCRLALQVRPDFAEAHFTLGNVLYDLWRLDDAEASYRRALEGKPDFVEALNNLALLFNAQGKSTMALNTIQRSLRIKDTEAAKSIFVSCVKRMRCIHNDSEIRITMVRALSEPWGRPKDLARISIELLKLDPDTGSRIARAANAWPAHLSAQDLFGANGLAILTANPLLCALLDSTPICDIEMERFLTMARRIMLEAATGISASDDELGVTLGFSSVLARQCFINEYVFSHTDAEIRKAGDLRDSLVTALEAHTQVPALWPVVVAAYFPLYSLPLADRLLERPWPEAVATVLKQQIREPTEELQLRSTIPRLTNIKDGVSLLVQNQYEENPYPRWVKTEPAGKPRNIAAYLRQKFPLSSFKRPAKNGSIDILIAGCGTGQHSIGTAQLFQRAQVLAIDLSMASLCYAKRKTQNLGLTSIEYAQADLLELGSLGRSFDVIESAGVLHHLDEPWAGWQVLLSLLRPDGFMRLGFYSEVARQNIVRIRDIIAEHGYGSSANEIRRFRQDLIDLNKSGGFETTLKSSAFFSISTCRDLLFHVQEHRMTLVGIDAFLRKNNLAFLGFEIHADALHAYKQRFPNDRAATNLGQWQIFENENPDTFRGMYQFWVQKVCY